MRCNKPDIIFSLPFVRLHCNEELITDSWRILIILSQASREQFECRKINVMVQLIGPSRKSGKMGPAKGLSPSSLMRWSISAAHHTDSKLPPSSADLGFPKYLAMLSALLRFMHRYSLKSSLFTGWRTDLKQKPFMLSCKNIPTWDKRWSGNLHRLVKRGGKNHAASENIYFWNFRNIFYIFKIFYYSLCSLLYFIFFGNHCEMEFQNEKQF